MDTVDYIAKYEMIGISGDWSFIRHYMTHKYPTYYTDPYGSNLFRLFIEQQISPDEYARLITSGEWVAMEMTQFNPGWGCKQIIYNVDSPLIADEIKKAGGLLIRLDNNDWYDDPTGIDVYNGFDLRISICPYAIGSDGKERLFNEINRRLSEKATIQLDL